jgi:hypothetical protein
MAAGSRCHLRNCQKGGIRTTPFLSGKSSCSTKDKPVLRNQRLQYCMIMCSVGNRQLLFECCIFYHDLGRAANTYVRLHTKDLGRPVLHPPVWLLARTLSSRASSALTVSAFLGQPEFQTNSCLHWLALQGGHGFPWHVLADAEPAWCCSFKCTRLPCKKTYQLP